MTEKNDVHGSIIY